MTWQFRTRARELAIRGGQTILDSRLMRGVLVRLILTWRLWRTRRAVNRQSPSQESFKVAPLDAWTRRLSSIAVDLREHAESLSNAKSEWETHEADVRYVMAASFWRMYTMIDRRANSMHLYAMACKRANLRDEAYAALKQVAESKDGADPEVIVAVTREAAQEAWARRERETALEFASRLRGPGKDVYGRYSGLLAIRDGLALIDAGRVDAAEGVLAGALLALGFSGHQASRVSRIYCATVRPATESRKAALEPRAAPTCVPVILPGFGWSGSGALLDYLKGFPGVEDPLHGRETELFSGQNGLYTIFRSFDGGWKSRRILRRFLAHYCFGHIVPGAHVKGRNAQGLWKRIAKSRREQFLLALEHFVGSLCGTKPIDGVVVRRAVRNFTGDVVDCLATGGRYLVLGNCITAKDVASVQVFNEPIVIVSWRDCVDAYVSKRLAFPQGSLNASRWMKQAAMRAETYLQGKELASGAAKYWQDIRFEEFVRDANVRDSLAESLGLDRNSWQRTFDPSHSQRNIDLQGYLSRRDLNKFMIFRAEMTRLYYSSRAIVSCSDSGSTGPAVPSRKLPVSGEMRQAT